MVSFNSPKPVIVLRIKAPWEVVHNIQGGAKKTLKNDTYEWLYGFE